MTLMLIVLYFILSLPSPEAILSHPIKVSFHTDTATLWHRKIQSGYQACTLQVTGLGFRHSRYPNFSRLLILAFLNLFLTFATRLDISQSFMVITFFHQLENYFLMPSSSNDLLLAHGKTFEMNSSKLYNKHIFALNQQCLLRENQAQFMNIVSLPDVLRFQDPSPSIKERRLL